MKTSKDRNSIYALLFSVIILFSSCSQYETSDQSDQSMSLTNSARLMGEKVTAENTTEEDLFKSLVFLDGPLTDQLGELVIYSPTKLGMTSEDIGHYRAFQNDFIQNTMKSDPQFFAEFKENIISREYSAVSQALKSAANKVQEYANEQMKKSQELEEYSLEKFVSDYQTEDFEISTGEDCIEIILLILLGVVINVAYNINYNVNTTVNVNRTRTRDFGSLNPLTENLIKMKKQYTLSKDQLILSIVNNI